MSIDATWLSMWLIDNYLRKCSKLCPDNISRLFDDISTGSKLQNAVSAVVLHRLNNKLLDSFYALNAVQYQIECVSADCLTARSCVYFMAGLAKMDSCLSVYFMALAFLHVAHKSSRYGLDDEWMDILATLCGQYIDNKHCCYNSTSLLSLCKAAKLMKFVANKPLSTMSLIAIELSKAYLYRALRCEDSDSDSIYCLTNVYLAVLYYTTGQYQTAIDHCTLVMRSQDHSQCSSHVVQGELLPKNDETDNALGLSVFYQYVRIAALNQQCQSKYASVFTTELFAYYLHINCLPFTACRQFMQPSSTDEFRRYKICISHSKQLFIGDVLLFVSLSRLLKQPIYHKPDWQKSRQRTTYTYVHNCSYLSKLLQTSAVEYLTAFRQIEARDFRSVATIITTDFEALLAYKRGDYQRCLLLSARDVHTLLYAIHMPNVPTFPEFIQLFDDDIVSLTALTLIVNPKCRGDTGYVRISQLTLSLYLMTQGQLKLRHSVMSLAQTLSYTKVAHKRNRVWRTLDRLVLKVIAHRAVTYITTMMNKVTTC